MPESTTRPRFPIYIPSKSRADTGLTARFLDRIRVPYRLVVEKQQWSEYRRNFPASSLLVLDAAYQERYDTFDDLGGAKSRGPGPARNFIWDHAVAEGWPWHWVMDDNIRLFARLHQNKRLRVGDGTIFHAMETFVLRYVNIGMAGPQYWMFAPSRSHMKPYKTNTRIYSCNLIRNDLRMRWRGRYNEDTDLSLRMLKAGWCTVQFNAFLQEKMRTQICGGGNTAEFYAAEGTTAKSRMLADMHPDVAKVVWRFGRVHHYVDYRPFETLKLIRRPDTELEPAPTYRFTTAPADWAAHRRTIQAARRGAKLTG